MSNILEIKSNNAMKVLETLMKNGFTEEQVEDFIILTLAYYKIDHPNFYHYIINSAEIIVEGLREAWEHRGDN